MTESDWVLTAAIVTLGYDSAMSFVEATSIAKELYLVWPGLLPQDAVHCFFAPDLIQVDAEASTFALLY